MNPTRSSTYDLDLYDGADAHGVSNVVGALLTQNFAENPHRAATARKMRRPVAIVSTDTDTSCTVAFGDSSATVYNGITAAPGVVVFATVDQILDLSQLRMKAGGLLPVGFLTTRGLGVLGNIARRRLVVKGLFIHPIATLHLLSLVSVES